MSQPWAQPTFPNPQIDVTETIQGDLILTGHEVRIIANTHLVVLGKISVEDSSQLVIRQSIIEVKSDENSSAVATGIIEILHEGSLRADTSIFGAVAMDGIDPAQAEALKGLELMGAGHSKIFLNNCFSQTQSFFDHAKVEMKNSFLIQGPLGLIHVEQSVDINLEDCHIGAILVDLPPNIEYDIDSLVPGYHESWSAREEISDELPYQLHLKRCTLNENNVGYQGGLEMGWNLGLNASTTVARISNSKLNKIIFGFPPGESATISGLRIQQPINFTLNQIEIINTEVQTQWGIFMEDGPATLTDCEGLFIFMLGGTAPIKVIDSEVYEIDPRDYVGTITFDNSIFGGGYEVFDSSHLFMTGAMRAMRPSPFLDASSKITRLHDIQILFDKDGTVFPPFPFRITREGEEIWLGVADGAGLAQVEITYDLSNYDDSWIIESLDPAVIMRKAFGLNSSNPMVINLTMLEGDSLFRPVLHVQRGAMEFPNGSRLHPYPTIQEAIENASGEIVQVPAGTYPGHKAPGEMVSSISLADHVILQGAGADSTILDAAVLSEAFDSSAIIGFEIKGGFHLIDAGLAIQNCLVADNIGHAIVGVHSDLKVHNNTLVRNAGDALLFVDSTEADVRNNILVLNEGFGLETRSGSTITSNYNNVWSNGDNYVNAEDIGEHDISLDPLFVDLDDGDYHLQEGSPCIDAGDPGDRFNDRDGSRNDMGALGGPMGTLVTNLSDLDLATHDSHLTIQPNPLKQQTQIKFYTIDGGSVQLTLYDLHGRPIGKVLHQHVKPGWYDLTWQRAGLPSGVYLLNLKTDSGMITVKMVVL